MTMEAFGNALAVDMALGGSTNSILHLQAIAHEAGLSLSLEAAEAVSRRTPNLCRIAPSGPPHIEDLGAAGGVPAVMKELAAPDPQRRPDRRDRRTIGNASAGAEPGPRRRSRQHSTSPREDRRPQGNLAPQDPSLSGR
jgi:dihydroxyacid dehydratase/phosphogluconate dehydratase